MAGFYGDNIITSMSAMTDFNFDKIYSNRFEMDSNSQTDGVYQGRYVLVEYTNTLSFFENEVEGCKIVDGVTFVDGAPEYVMPYIQQNGENIYITSNEVQYVKIKEKEEYYLNTNQVEQSDQWFKLTNLYDINYAIDQKKYNITKGYDSTVWIKRITNEGEKYIEVGSLNALQTDFILKIDSPLGSDPNNEIYGPYYDNDSTDLVKNLHIQAPWRFNTGKIDFNKKGFDPETSSIISEEDQIILTTERINKDYKYANEKEEFYPDTQILNINMPSIGNVISKVWDVIYGEGDPNNDGLRNFEARNTTSLQGILNSYSDLKQNSIPLYKDNNIVSSKLVETDWINPLITDNQEIVIEHKKINDTSLPAETTSYNFGYYTINMDEAGHVRAVEEAELIINCGGAQL